MASVTPGYTFVSSSDPLTYSKLNLLGQPTVTIGAGEVTTTMLADNSVTLAKQATVATGTLLGRKTASTGNVEAIVINNTAITQPTTGFVVGNTAAASSILIGQSATAVGGIVWNYNGTESAASLDITTYAQQMNFTASNYLMIGTSSARELEITTTHNVILGNAAIATNATTGFLHIVTCAGTPTGTPTLYTGRVPMVFDTTGVKIWFYTGGAWKGVVVA